MGVLPTGTLLGKLEIVEIYEYYDQPLLFACRNASDTLFLVVLEDEEELFDSWLYVSMSNLRYTQIRSGGISLHNAFKNAEEGFVFLVKIYHQDELPSEINIVPVAELIEAQLPEEGEYLGLDTPTLESNQISLERRATQASREYVEVALEFPERNRTEAPILVLGDLMRHLQKTLISIGHTVSDFHKESKKPTRDLTGKLELSLVDVKAGSFTLEMASSQSSDMFGDTLLGDALDEFARLIEIGSDETNLEKLFNDYKRSVPKEYLKLLKTIRTARVDRARVRWASANGQRGGETILSAPIVFATIDSIEQMTVTETNIIRVTGTLTGVFTSRTFEITTQDRIYRGTMDNQALSVSAAEIINRGKMQGRYTVQLREQITRRIATDDITTRYFLIDVEEVK